MFNGDTLGIWPKIIETAEGRVTKSLQTQKPKEPKKMSRKMLYGFSICAPEEIQVETTEDAFPKQVLKDRATITAHMHALGFPKVCVVLPHFFNQVCWYWGLYRIENITENSRTGSSRFGWKEEENATFSGVCVAFLISLMAIPAIVLSRLLGHPWHFAYPWILGGFFMGRILGFDGISVPSRISSAIIALLSSFWAGKLLMFEYSVPWKVAAGILLLLVPIIIFLVSAGKRFGVLYEIPARCALMVGCWIFFKIAPRWFLLWWLFPGRVDVEMRGDNGVGLEFLNPTDHEGQGYFDNAILQLQKAGLQPMVAAVSKAIKINRNSVIQSALAQVKRFSLGPMLADPIAYTILMIDDRPYVVVVAAYGEFAEEQEVMKWVERSGFLYCCN